MAVVPLRRTSPLLSAVVGCCCTLLLPAVSDAQDDKCMTFDEQTSVDNVSTMAQLKFNTLQQARNRMLAQLGVELSGTTQIDRGGDGDKSYTAMQQGISQETRGWITKDSVLDWRTHDGGRTYTLKYQGCARSMVGRRDPAFTVRASLDKDPPAYLDNGPGLRDSIVVRATVSQPAFLTVFHRSGDTLAVLYPSAVLGSAHRVHLTTNGEVRVPRANRMRTQLTGGNKKTMDWMIVVATKQEIPLAASPVELPPGRLHTLTWREYVTWLNRIPLEERVVVELPFTIERTRP